MALFTPIDTIQQGKLNDLNAPMCPYQRTRLNGIVVTTSVRRWPKILALRDKLASDIRVTIFAQHFDQDCQVFC